MTKLFEFKTDCYQEKRGGYSSLLEIYCKVCSSFLFFYQKDGEGDLFRCYLNRILSPEIYASLQDSENIKNIDDMTQLICQNCKEVIGEPMRHGDNRLAFCMHQECFILKTNKNKGTYE